MSARRRRRVRESIAREISTLEPRLALTANLISANLAGTNAGDHRSIGTPVFDDSRDSTRQLSSDGRYVLFTSDATNVAPNPIGGADALLNQGNIYVRDRQTGTTKLVNVSVDGSAYGDAADPSMTPDGRYVTFIGGAYDGRFGVSPLVRGVSFPANITLGHQLYVRDLLTSTTKLVSVRPDGIGSGGNDDDVSFHASISADGSKIAFVGGAFDDLVAGGDSNHQADIFVRDMKTGTTTLISRNAAGTNSGNNRSYSPTISADGKYVTFLSDATNLTNLPDTNNQPDLFSYSFSTGKVTLLSTNTAKTAASNTGVQPLYRMDDSGLKVGFLSRSTDLMPGTGFNFFNINFFVRDVAAGTTRLISHGPSGNALGVVGSDIGLSRDGSTATFVGDSGFVTEAPDDVTRQIYLANTTTGQITLVSRSPQGAPGNSESSRPTPSANGRFVLFSSSAENLVRGVSLGSDASGSKLTLFAYDRVTRDVLPLSTIANGAQTVATDGAFAGYYAISRDGSTVVFTSEFTGLGVTDTNRLPDVYWATTRLDTGDAPTAAQSGFAKSYPTTLANKGARHIAVGPMLGTKRDLEADGVPTAAANGDDTTGTPDDEDGISVISDVFSSPTHGAQARFTIRFTNPNPRSNKLDAFIDFNQDGDWSDRGERIANSVDLGTTAGTREITFSVPAGAVGGQTMGRFRVSSAGGLGPTGFAADGEVEDQPVTVVALPAVERTYRAYNPNANFHFFTTSYGEFTAAVRAGYRDESSGQDGFAVEPQPTGDAVPVYRVYNLSLGYHYYTTSKGERDILVNLVPAPKSGPDTRKSGWRDEGTIGFIPSNAATGTTTIYRLYNTDSGVHLLTHDPAVRDAVLAITAAGSGRHPWQLHSNFGFAFAIAASDELLDPSLFSTGTRSAIATAASEELSSSPRFASIDTTSSNPAASPGTAAGDERVWTIAISADASRQASPSELPEVEITDSPTVSRESVAPSPDQLPADPVTIANGLDAVFCELLWDAEA